VPRADDLAGIVDTLDLRMVGGCTPWLPPKRCAIFQNIGRNELRASSRLRPRQYIPAEPHFLPDTPRS
jgi:hypothetical protein